MIKFAFAFERICFMKFTFNECKFFLASSHPYPQSQSHHSLLLTLPLVNYVKSIRPSAAGLLCGNARGVVAMFTGRFCCISYTQQSSKQTQQSTRQGNDTNALVQCLVNWYAVVCSINGLPKQHWFNSRTFILSYKS